MELDGGIGEAPFAKLREQRALVHELLEGVERAASNPRKTFAPRHLHLSCPDGYSAQYVIDQTRRKFKTRATFTTIRCSELEGNQRSFIADLMQDIHGHHDGDRSAVATLAEAAERIYPHDATKAFVVVLEDADSLNSFPVSFLRSFFQLPVQLADKKTCCWITVARRPWYGIQTSELLSTPVCIDFAPLTSEEQLSILKATARRLIGDGNSKARNEEAVTSLAAMVHSGAAVFTNEPHAQIRLMEDVVADLRTKPDWQSAGVRKTVKESVDRKVLRRFYRDPQEANAAAAAIKETSLGKRDLLILVASFLASCNAPATDTRFFARAHHRQKVHSATTSTELPEGGFRSFDLERLRFIVLALLRSSADVLHSFGIVNVHEDMGSRVTTLSTLGFLTRTSGMDNLNAKFRSNWTRNRAVQAAQTLGIPDFGDYLQR